MIRPTVLLIALASVSAVALRAGAPVAVPAAAPAGPVQQADLSADTTTMDEATGDTVLTGKAMLVDKGLLLNADEIRFNQRTQIAVASGNVVLTRIGDRVLADRLTLKRSDGTFTAVNIRIGKFPFYIKGPTAEGSRREVLIHNATVTYGEPSRWQPTVKARTLTYSPGHYLRLSSADIGVGDYLPLPISRLGQDLARQSDLATVKLDGGYRHSLGPYADAAVGYPVADGVSAGPDIGLYTFRGLMLGPFASYDITKGDDTMAGLLRSGYIYDYGDKKEDILNNPVPDNRAYIEWQHNQQIGPNLEINGDINYSTDSEVIRDFHSKDFVPIQEPDNFVEAIYSGPDYIASAFTRFQPDAFYPVQERTPEIRYDQLPTLIGAGIYVRLDSSIAHLEENPPDGGSHLEDDRFDAFLGFSRPFSYKGFFDITPVVGGRFTEYWDTAGAEQSGGTGRALGEIGFDADLKLSSTWEYKNAGLHVDGLRHLLTPILSYRYIPDADKSTAFIPPIDRATYTTYLPVLDLGDIRTLDQLQAENVMRVGLRNTLQTRDATYGSRDLLMIDVEDDIRLERAPGQSDFSRIFTELKATPARWLELRVEDSVSSNGLAQRARDATITVREGQVWSCGFGVGFLSDNFKPYVIPGLGPFPIVGLDTYHAEVRVRLNEQFEVFARGDYDDRAHLFVDQFYGISQRVTNTWIVEYGMDFSNGPTPDNDHFGLFATINMLRF